MSNEMTQKTLLLALILVLTAMLGTSAVVRAADIAGWEAETMVGNPSKVTVVSDTDASGGQALRYTARGRADKLDQRFSTMATALEVRARAVQDAGGWPTMKVYVDGTAMANRIAAQVVDSSSYVTYRFDVSVPPGMHDVHVKAYENMGQDQELVVDRVAFENPARPADADIDGIEEPSDNCPDVANADQADTDADGVGDACDDDTSPPGSDCDKFASTTGSDADAGTRSNPYETVDKLAESLVAGQAGCIMSGVYDQDVFLAGGGVPDNPITVREYPGESVELRGTFRTNAPWVAVEGLRIDGSYGPQVIGAPYDRAEVKTRPAVDIDASHTTWRDLDVSNRRANNDPDLAGQCFTVGNGATDTLISGSRIHHCGQVPKNNHQHAIYASHTTGLVMRGNVVYESADRALQMYPNADSSLIEGNVFAHNGDVAVHFSGRGAETSDNNLVRNNVITHTDDWNVNAFDGQLAAGVEFPKVPANRNEVVNNCVFPGPNTKDPQTGGIEPTTLDDRDYFYTQGNVIAFPLYVSPLSEDFRPQPGSICAAILINGQLA